MSQLNDPIQLEKQVKKSFKELVLYSAFLITSCVGKTIFIIFNLNFNQ